MANATGQAVFTAQMPAPPPFWQHFTKQNVSRVKELQERGEPIPEDLLVLAPPDPPESGISRPFGEALNINEVLPSLHSYGQEQLYPDSIGPAPASPGKEDGSISKVVPEWTLDRAKYLKKTVRSILLNFLELIDILSEDPSEADFKLKHITTLFLNAHHMLNEYRPHQARETLILMMEEEISKKKARIQAIKDMKSRMDSMAGEIDNLPTVETHTNGMRKKSGKGDANTEIWNDLNDLGDS